MKLRKPRENGWSDALVENLREPSVVSDPLTSYGFGGLLLAGGIALVGRQG